MKRPKSYPMNGPSLEVQALMQFPRRNHTLLKRAFKVARITRPETVALCNLK